MVPTMFAPQQAFANNTTAAPTQGLGGSGYRMNQMPQGIGRMAARKAQFMPNFMAGRQQAAQNHGQEYIGGGKIYRPQNHGGMSYAETMAQRGQDPAAAFAARQGAMNGTLAQMPGGPNMFAQDQQRQMIAQLLMGGGPLKTFSPGG